MRATTAAWVAAAVALAWGTRAQAAPGDRLIALSDAGTVVEFSAGGDLSTAEPFATGLSEPLGLCVGPGGEIYVAESASGEITIITEGGDFSQAAPFAFGPFTPVDLSCTETSILVTVPLPPIPAVADITQGGNVVQNIELHATGLPSPISLARDGAGALYSANPDIFDVTIAGDFTDAAPFATGQDTTTLTWTGQALWAGVTGAPEIYDVTAGGDLSAAAPVVTLPTVGVGQIDGLLTTLDGTIYAVTGNQIYDVTAGGDLTGALPFATGLQSGQRGFTGMLEHVCSADSDCFDDDLCNGPERCVDNRCLPAEQPLSCDDDDACTNDGCQPADGCTHDPVPACCDEDLDCAVDALCDVEAMTCMPVGTVPTTGMDTESDDTAMVPTTGDTDGAEGDATGSGGEQDGEGNDGCGCRQSTREGGPWWALLVLAVAGRRRGRGSGRPATPS